MNKFERLGLSEDTIRILERKGYTEPTEIQEKAIPMLLGGTRNIIGKSQTGTGKTAGFALPILERLKPGKNVNTLILAPTRELAMQVRNEIESLKGEKKVSTLTVYGGTPIGPQISSLKRGVDIVVGTPGRVLDLIERKVLKLGSVDYVVLDEADEMLNMGFVDDIEKILGFTRQDRQMLLFSATMPKGILKIVDKFMDDYELITVDADHTTPVLTEQIYYDVMSHDRIECLKRVMDSTDDFYGIVFSNTKIMADSVANDLIKKGYAAAALHGDISQVQREQILAQFRKKKLNILVATDVAARGIDVNDLTHVINYSLPQSPELYVHRIGRTGRAGKKGIAITFVIPSERRKLKFIENVVKQKLRSANIPSIEGIRQMKEKRCIDIIHNIIEKSKGAEKFAEIADGLVASYGERSVILALLQYSFKNEFSAGDYKEIKAVSSGQHGRPGGSGRDGRSRFRRGNDSHNGNRRKQGNRPAYKKNAAGNPRASHAEGKTAWHGFKSGKRKDRR